MFLQFCFSTSLESNTASPKHLNYRPLPSPLVLIIEYQEEERPLEHRWHIVSNSNEPPLFGFALPSLSSFQIDPSFHVFMHNMYCSTPIVQRIFLTIHRQSDIYTEVWQHFNNLSRIVNPFCHCLIDYWIVIKDKRRTREMLIWDVVILSGKFQIIQGCA